ncbi:MAG TPA: hypothetical protein DD473_25425 [Planctomycetaceae bacterium]|nr:hypothetical protein [Planctomycetaceae bacterium]
MLTFSYRFRVCILSTKLRNRFNHYQRSDAQSLQTTHCPDKYIADLARLYILFSPKHLKKNVTAVEGSFQVAIMKLY